MCLVQNIAVVILLSKIDNILFHPIAMIIISDSCSNILLRDKRREDSVAVSTMISIIKTRTKRAFWSQA